MSDAPVRVRRCRIEEIRALAGEYERESAALSGDGRPWDQPIPRGAMFWIAEDAGDATPLGYAAGALRPGEGLTLGPVFTRGNARRRGVAFELLSAIQQWADDTRVPVVEVSVDVDNEDGRAFLERSGYVPRRVLFSRRPTPRAHLAAAPEPTDGS